MLGAGGLEAGVEALPGGWLVLWFVWRAMNWAAASALGSVLVVVCEGGGDGSVVVGGGEALALK